MGSSHQDREPSHEAPHEPLLLHERPRRETGRSFCLLGEATGGREAPACAIGTWEPVMIPPGRSDLVMPAEGPPRVASVAGPEQRRLCALEPIRRERAFQLLLAAAPGEPLRVNGVPAPPLAVLEERDVITFDEGRVSFHLSSYVRPYVGPALPEHEGRSCTFCGTPLPAGCGVYVCPFCDSPAHLDTEDRRDGSQRLECAAHMQSCPQCLNPVVTREGLTSIPEEVRGG